MAPSLSHSTIRRDYLRKRACTGSARCVCLVCTRVVPSASTKEWRRRNLCRWLNKRGRRHGRRDNKPRWLRRIPPDRQYPTASVLRPRHPPCGNSKITNLSANEETVRQLRKWWCWKENRRRKRERENRCPVKTLFDRKSLCFSLENSFYLVSSLLRLAARRFAKPGTGAMWFTIHVSSFCKCSGRKPSLRKSTRTMQWRFVRVAALQTTSAVAYSLVLGFNRH